MHRFGILLICLLAARVAWGETLEMVTYYPAPGGGAAANQDLHVRSLTVGIPYAAVAPGDGEALIFDWLGIGTNAPAGPLHVVGADDALSQVFFMPGADTGAAGVPEIRVGIGTEAPVGYASPVFHVRTAGAAGNNFYEGAVHVGGATAVLGGQLSYHNYNSGRVSLVNLNDSNSAASTLSLGFGSINLLTGRPNDETMTLTSAGNVGIGINDPSERLEVNGNIELPNSSAAAGNLFKAGAVRFLHDFGTDNTFLGRNAGNFSLTTGGGAPSVRNTGIGASALDALTTGIENTAVGVNALGGITTGPRNTAVGEGALGAATTGGNNTAVGYRAMNSATTPLSCTTVGAFALESNTIGEDNVAVGATALRNNTSGNWNVAVGSGAMRANTTGRDNVAIGTFAMSAMTTATDNVIIGHNAGNGSSASNNVFIGSGAGSARGGMVPGGGNVFIGYDVGSGRSVSNRLMIDNFDADYPLISGNFATNTLTVNGGLTVTGNITTGSLASGLPKTFEIPHPAKPGYTLTHAVLEGPEIAVFYRGEGRLEGGKAEVLLPDYFEKLTREEGRTVTLTAKGAEPYLLSYEEVKGGRFTVHGTQPDGAFSWEVKAVCSAAPPLEVEKPAN